MKLTGRLLIAFGFAQLVAVLCKLTVDGSASLCFYLDKWIVLDLGAVALIAAGWAVSHESRPGRIVAVVLSFFYTLSAVYVLTTTAFSGIGRTPIWQLLVALALGTWSSTNLLLLIRLADLKSCLPRYSLKMLLMLVLLVAIGLAGIRWLRELGRPPHFASVSAIEQRYAQQLANLRKLAVASLGPANATAINSPINAALFDGEEIFNAGVTPVIGIPGTSSRSTHLARRSASRKYRSTIGFYRAAGVEQPAVTLWNQEDEDGKRLTLAIYENRVIDTHGSQVAYFIEFDLNRLRESAAADVDRALTLD